MNAFVESPLGDARLASEWLEADGLGGFASGTVSGLRTRRYHALLLAASTPTGRRFVLVNGMEAWLATAAGHFALSSQLYTPDTIYPDARNRLIDFRAAPWPQWTFLAEDGTVVVHEICVNHGIPGVLLRWQLRKGGAAARLVVRPLVSGRDYHALHHGNDAFSFEPEAAGTSLTWRPYHGVPAISMHTNGDYRHEPLWYRNFVYRAELERGLDAVEDLASPGSFDFDLAAADAVIVLQAGELASSTIADPGRYVRTQFEREALRRAEFASPLERAASAYIVRRRRSAGHPAHRQARRNSGAVDQCAQDRQRVLRGMGRVIRTCSDLFPDAFLERGARLPVRRGRCQSRSG